MCVAQKNIQGQCYRPYMLIIFYQKHFLKFSLLKKTLTFALRIASTFKNSLSLYRKVHITNRDGSIAKEPTILA